MRLHLVNNEEWQLLNWAHLIFWKAFRLEIVGSLQDKPNEEEENIALHQVGDAGKLLGQRRKWRWRVAFRLWTSSLPQPLSFLRLGLAFFGVVVEENVVLGVELRAKLVHPLAAGSQTGTKK